jgi:crotonobetainyl-CoA:carnitine CoA-transferase CaiB-like acyl-CoA transferase
VKVVASPIKMSATPPEARTHPPLLGEHTTSVLAEVLGYDEATIAQLRASKAI